MKISGWFGFWLFMTVYICIEGYMYMNGHDTLFWKHKTTIEQQLQMEELRTRQMELLLNSGDKK